MRWIAWLTLPLLLVACSRSQSGDDNPPDYAVNGFHSPKPAPLPDHAVATAPADEKSPMPTQPIRPKPVPPPPPADLPPAQIPIELAKLSVSKPIPSSDLIKVPVSYGSQIDLKAIRKAVFDEINHDRLANGLNALTYDPIAERAGNLQNSREVDAGHMLGHYSTNGDLPYMRYSEVGGYDSEAENWASAAVFMNQGGTHISDDPNVAAHACGEETFDPPTPDNVQAILLRLALGLHCGMLNELPGHDGHRKAILDPYRTSVGIGVGVAVVTETDSPTPKLRIFMTEEFTNRVLTVTQALPLAINIRQTSDLSFHAQIPAGLDFDQMMLFFEERKPLSPDQASRIDHYSFPNIFTLFLPELSSGIRYSPATYSQYPDLQVSAVVSRGDLTLPLAFHKGAGVYTMVIWLKNHSTQSSQQVTSRSIFATD